ncbi:helix-turn-helix domain-containing protein [Streptomyces sp. SID9124]|uniref:helix-turn-helix domain-containing protein n=1 Tax=Streptomyces sp. SID9124 TaxID=2706108 RepID=UPI0013DEE49B|nr:helix-turn-helix domain-containing protein [Streptomyces sp. SID9124]NED13601.1 helix-turn-helix domain-containing protein [Streptomyces sp. SID9124]
MATPQAISPPRTPSGSAATGVQHVNVRHISGFTVIGNHLAQHAQLSLTAIGLAAHIQSLPTGARVGIKLLAARFPESEARIAAALRELEAAGYLHRSRVRLADGRVVTRTTSYNQPHAKAPAPAPEKQEPAPAPPPEPQPQPQPHPEAATLLTGLRRHAPQLALSAAHINELAPAVATWLARDVHPATIRHALTSDLPPLVRHPAGFVRNRLTALLPPPLPATPEAPPAAIPLQDCDRCDRVFRAPEPGHCRDCREAEPHRAA